MKYSIGDKVVVKDKQGIIEDYDSTSYTVQYDNGYVENVPMKIVEVQCKQNCDAENLIIAIKVANINLKTLHRNLSGGNWFRIHEQLGSYYEKLEDFEDAVVENFIAMGCNDVSIAEYVHLILPVKKYEEKEAMSLAKSMLDSIKNLSMACRKSCNINTDVAPVLDELENWIHIESDYKLNNYLN